MIIKQQVCVQLLRKLTTWHYQHLCTATCCTDVHVKQSIDISYWPGLLLWPMLGQTVIYTDDWQMHRPCSPY